MLQVQQRRIRGIILAKSALLIISYVYLFLLKKILVANLLPCSLFSKTISFAHKRLMVNCVSINGFFGFEFVVHFI